MTTEFAIWICKQTIFTALLIAAPMLISGLAIGILIALFQAATQIQEMTLTFIPKIIVVITVLLFTLPWIINMVTSFTREIFSFIAGGF